MAKLKEGLPPTGPRGYPKKSPKAPKAPKAKKKKLSEYEKYAPLLGNDVKTKGRSRVKAPIVPFYYDPKHELTPLQKKNLEAEIDRMLKRPIRKKK